ncbi:unnamed protein product [Prorocentrum cordatum]|uniref:Uncharacterized protein n=1 Tax=Prorocentrum cordatum TaxID=2364126 RepID=A0ABN9UGG5_9DINO|nr:unnamed protein product [Polarella glacialis]
MGSSAPACRKLHSQVVEMFCHPRKYFTVSGGCSDAHDGQLLAAVRLEPSQNRCPYAVFQTQVAAMELSDTVADRVAISIAGVRWSCISSAGVIQIAYVIDLAIRVTCLFSDGSVFVDFSEAGCEVRGGQQTCFEGELVIFVMQWWLYMELALNCGKGIGMALLLCLLGCLTNAGRMGTGFGYVQKVLGFQQTLTFVSIFLFICYFAGVHSYLGKATMHTYSTAVMVSVFFFLFAEVVRRRLEGLHLDSQRLMVRGDARARADVLPRVRHADLENDPGSFQERMLSHLLGRLLARRDFNEARLRPHFPHNLHPHLACPWISVWVPYAL